MSLRYSDRQRRFHGIPTALHSARLCRLDLSGAEMLKANVDIHEGTPLGSMQLLHDLQTYVSTPKTTLKGKVNTIIMIPDMFGIYVNAKLLADDWAGQGYKVLMPDVTEGDPVPVEMLNVSGSVEGCDPIVQPDKQ